MMSKSNSPYSRTYAVAMPWSDALPSICSQRNFSRSVRSRKRSVSVFFRMKVRSPATRDFTSEISKAAAAIRWGRDWRNPSALPISRTSKLSSSRRTRSSSFAGTGRAGRGVMVAGSARPAHSAGGPPQVPLASL